MEKEMSKFLLVFMSVVLLFSFMAVPVLAGINPDLSDLTDEEKAKIVLEAKKLKDERSPLSKVDIQSTPQKVNEWIDVGKNLGVALMSTAKELGVAMDTFLSSKTGQMATYVILWKLLWKDVLGVIVGGLMLLSFNPMWFYFYRRMCIVKSKTVTYPTEKGAKKEKKWEYYTPGSCDGTRALMWCMFAVLNIIPLLIIFK
jgi:hypothetical protein